MGVRNDPYVVLGVTLTASTREVEAAYRRRLRELDASDDDTTEQRRALRLAYQLLSDPIGRLHHDAAASRVKAPHAMEALRRTTIATRAPAVAVVVDTEPPTPDP